MLDDAADRIARLVRGGEGNEQSMVAQRPSALVTPLAKAEHLRRPGLAGHQDPIERELGADGGAALVHDRGHCVPDEREMLGIRMKIGRGLALSGH